MNNPGIVKYCTITKKNRIRQTRQKECDLILTLYKAWTVFQNALFSSSLNYLTQIKGG